MSRTIFRALPLVSVLIVAGGAAISASAQTAPTPDVQQQAGVREMLNRAEAESRRHSVRAILGNILGIWQAAAQPAPPAAPRTAARAGQPVSVALEAPAARTGASTVPQATGPAQDTGTAQPAAGAQSPTTRRGSGTPFDPFIIATARPTGAETAPPAAGEAAAPIDPDVHPRPREVATDADAPRTVIAEHSVRHREGRFRRSNGYRYGPIGCPSDRW
jgi:hypothetical protein